MAQGSTVEFGRSIALHRGSFGAGGWFWYVGGALILAGIVGPVRAAVAPTAQQTAVGAGDVLVTGAIALVVGFLLLIVPLLRWRQQVELFENGFVWTRLTGGDRIGRDQVRAVQLITHISKMSRYTEVKLTLGDGRELSMSGLEQAEQLANVLNAYARPAAAPAMAPGAPAGWSPPSPGGWTPPAS